MIKLFLFYNGSLAIDMAKSSSIDGLVIDCESFQKHDRQIHFDTEINEYTPKEVSIVRRELPDTYLICRINGFTAPSEVAKQAVSPCEEAHVAVELGANEIFLPMVQSISQIEDVLERISNKSSLSLMIETPWAVEHAAALDRLPIKRVFVGLNDLMIQYGSQNLFENVFNGTVQKIRNNIRHAEFGFGGLTLPSYGAPIPCELLMSELARMRCDFTFLRRSFYRDITHSKISARKAIDTIQSAWNQCTERSSEQIEVDRSELWSLFTNRLHLKQKS
jgi:hypothetical protein